MAKKVKSTFCLIKLDKCGKRHYLSTIKGGLAIWVSCKRSAEFSTKDKMTAKLNRLLNDPAERQYRLFLEEHDSKVKPCPNMTPDSLALGSGFGGSINLDGSNS